MDLKVEHRQARLVDVPGKLAGLKVRLVNEPEFNPSPYRAGLDRSIKRLRSG